MRKFATICSTLHGTPISKDSGDVPTIESNSAANDDCVCELEVSSLTKIPVAFLTLQSDRDKT